MFFIVSFLTILNSGAVYKTFILYRQLNFGNKGGKTINLRFLNQINGNVLFYIENIKECSLKAANSKF